MSPATLRIELFRYCPRCGAEAMRQQSPHLVSCPACDLQLYQNASPAAAIILVDARAQVLLIRRAHDPGRGQLALPGGFIDNDESVEDGLRREVREEIGLDVAAMEFLVTHPNRYPYRGVLYHTIDLFFIARVPDFAAARALDAVTDLVIAQIPDVRAEDLAFVSMQQAWRVFLARRREDCGARSAES